MEPNQLFETIATQYPDPKQFADALHKALPDHFQVPYQAGHSDATTKKNDRIKALEDQVTTLEAERSQAVQDLEELQRTKPEVDEMRAKYEKTLKENADKALAEAKESNDLLRSIALGVERAHVVSELVNMGMERFLAEKVVDGDVMKRVHVKPTREARRGYNAEYYQTDGVTPFPMADGMSPYARIAQDVVNQMPEALRPRQGQRGSNLGAGPSQNGSLTITRSQFDALSVLDRHAFMAKPGAQVVDG